MRFDGRDDSVTLPALPSSADFTVSGWQHISAPKTTNNTLYGAFGSMRLLPRASGFYAGIWVDGREYVVQAATGSNQDRWVHWALVRAGDTMRVYRDGIEVGTRTGLPATQPTSLSGEIGRMGTSYAAAARTDEIAVYDQALGTPELRARYDLAGR